MFRGVRERDQASAIREANLSADSSCISPENTSSLRHMMSALRLVQRQWRKSHKDSHYCTCIFRYMREYALMMRDVSVQVCVDKHRVKVGEPLAAAECRRQVIVHSRSGFQVADHDFTRFSIIIYLN